MTILYLYCVLYTPFGNRCSKTGGAIVVLPFSRCLGVGGIASSLKKYNNMHIMPLISMVDGNNFERGGGGVRGA